MSKDKVKKSEHKEPVQMELPGMPPSTAVAVVQQGGALTVGSTPLGFEETEFSDLVVPRFVFMQFLSPEVAEGTAKPGEIWNSLDKTKNYGQEVDIIPVIHFKSRIRWLPKEQGGGILCRSEDGKLGVGDPGGNCQTCPLAGWIKDEKTGVSRPGCDFYENVVCVVRGDYSMPIALSGSRTKVRGIKELISLARFAGDDLFGRAYKVRSVQKKNSKGAYFVPQISPLGRISDDEKKLMLQMFKNVSRVKVKIDDTPEEMAAEPTIDNI